MPQEESSKQNDDRYDAQRIEPKWFERWQKDASLYAAEPHTTKPKYYVLEMLPTLPARCTWGTCAITPSAMRSPLHVDERLQRAAPHGMGFVRAPAENAAISANVPPRE